MRAGVREAWVEFDARFRPLLERYAARVGIPRWEWSACITEVLDDEALRLIERVRAMPQHLSAYLVRAVHNRHLALKRAAARREHRYAEAAVMNCGTGDTVGLVVSEHSRRACEPPRVAEELSSTSTVVRRFAEQLAERLTSDERELLAWVAEGVPQRVIAEWLAVNREAVKKRIARLSHRLRHVASELCDGLPIDGRREIERLLQRASKVRRSSRTGDNNDR